MGKLTIEAGGKLLAYTSESNQSGERQDVSHLAHQFLYDAVELGPICLQDIFGLLAKDPVLLEVYRRQFSKELLAYASLGPISMDVPPDDRIECLELYQMWEQDTWSHRLDRGPALRLHGLCRAPAGASSEAWRSVSVVFSDLRELLTLPVRLASQVTICEADFDAFAFGQVLQKVYVSVTLGELLHGVLWELSFYGAPQTQEEVSGAVLAQAQQYLEEQQRCEGHALPVVPGPNLMTTRMQAEVQAAFSSTGVVKPMELWRALRGLRDDAAVIQSLRDIFGAPADSLRIRPAFNGLSARAFRKAMRAAWSRTDSKP